MREVASVQDFKTNAVDDFRVFFPSAKLVIWHQSKKNCDEIFDAFQVQILSKSFGVEEIEEAAE